MKLRVRGNSLRLRVSQRELERITQHGVAEDAVHFAPGTALRYRLEAVPDGELCAEFADGEVRVRVPRAQIERWAAPDQVSIDGEQAVGGGEHLRILIEKDFSCLAPREGEDDSDLFPNPLAGTPPASV